MDGFFEETVLFEQGRVRITNRRVIAADGKSYPLPEIVAAEQEVDVPWDGRLALGMAVGCLIAFAGGSIFAGSPTDPMPGVGLFLAGAGIAVASYLVKEFSEQHWATHVIRVKFQSQEPGMICETGEAVTAELILRAIQVAMLVGNDTQSFRAVFYHPPIPGELKAAEPDSSDSLNNSYDPFD